MTTTYFRYRPIDQSVVQIRVLTLRPGSYDDPISCELTHYRLDQANDFEALSYCWGDPTPSHQVFIGTGSLMVTKSAHSALRHLRLKDRYRRIWIDAICINQADRDERSHQVKYMGQIFKGASRVLAWLGPASPGSAKAIDLVRAVSARSPMKPAIEVWHAVQAFRDLMERPFWSRTWILQEIICPERAPLIGCGTQWDDWGTWASANPVDMGVELEEVLNPKSSILGRQTMETYTRAFEIFSGINYLRDLASELHHHHNGQGITNLNEVLTMSINSNCSDIRDHVFAIVGMIHLDGIPATIQPPKPDYNKTVRQVYSEITKFAIESDQTLLILYLRTHRKTRNALPSWTPDFSCNEEQLRYPVLSRITRSVASQTEHLPRVLDDGETLRVHGKIIGTIQQTQSLFALRGVRGKTESVDEIIRFADLKDLYDCLTGGQDLGGETGNDGLAWFRETASNGCRFFDDSNLEPGFQARRPQVMETIRRTIALKDDTECPHRPLYKTINSRFQVGLGSPDCRAGDVVCVIAGGHAPMILRPIHHGRYEYVGDSYVPGHMEEDMERALVEDIGIEWARFDIG